MGRQYMDKEVFRELSQKQLKPWLCAALINWLCVGAAIILTYAFPHPLTLFFSVLIIGNRQHAFAILGHDGAHITLSRNKKLNDLLTNIFSFWPLGMTVSGYRSLHYKHHKHTGTEDDPELAHKRSRSPQWDLPSKPITVIKYALMDLVGFSLLDYWIIISYSKPDNPKQYIPLIFWHIIVAGGLVFAGFWLAPVLWYAGLATSFMMFFRLRLWLEHQGTLETHRLKLNFWEGAIFAPHNSWMHWEHHNWPSISFNKIPELRKHLKGTEIISLPELLCLYSSSKYIASGQPVSEEMR